MKASSEQTQFGAAGVAGVQEVLPQTLTARKECPLLLSDHGTLSS